MLRKPANTKHKRGAPKSRPVPLGAPVRGWNARDGLAEMDPLDAVVMDNMFPDTTSVRLRLGSATHKTGLPALTQSLLAYNGAATKKLFAAAGTAFYDVTAAGAVGAAVVSGLTNAKWQSVNFATAGGNYFQAVNGVDNLRLYDGATWEAVTGVSAHPITGIATTEFINIAVIHNRIWYVQKASLNAYYLPVNSISGAATVFPLGGVFTEGGTLLAIGAWTLDAGSGMDDFTAFITSEGEVAVYQGTDPASASTWALKGIYKIGNPVGYRCLSQFASDLLVITEEGVVPLTKALASSRISSKQAITDRIQSAMRDSIQQYKALHGWEVQVHPSQSLLVLNIPLNTAGAAQQYVMNTITGAWCRFLGWNSACYAVFNGELYFGSATTIVKAWTGASDLNAQITGDCLQAFSKLGSQQSKQAKLAQPLLGVTGPYGIGLWINVDYDLANPASTVASAATNSALWNTATWNGAVWGGGETLSNLWRTVEGLGYVMAPWLRLASQDGQVRWYSTSLKVEDTSGTL